MDSFDAREVDAPRAAPSAAASARPLQASDQFSPRLRQEYEAHGYRYISIGDRTKRSDAAQADKQNRKIYETAMKAHRQQDRFSTGSSAQFTTPEPPRPSNMERYETRQLSLKKVEGMAQTIAVYNLTQRGKVPFIDYQPHEAVGAWERYQRIQERTASSPLAARRLSAVAPGMPAASPHGAYPQWYAAPSHPVMIPGPVGMPGPMSWYSMAGTSPHSFPGTGAGSGPLNQRERTYSCPTPPPPSYPQLNPAKPQEDETPGGAPQATPQPTARPAPQAYMSGHAPAGRRI